MNFDRRSLLVLGSTGLSLPLLSPLTGTALFARTAPPRFPSCPVQPIGNFRPGPIQAFHIPAEDGTRLALDLVLPERRVAGKRIPTVLMMTRYWRREVGKGLNDAQKFYASHGFAVVIGDVRGTGASFGTWPYHRSRAETYDFGAIMDWIVAQPWSDGRIAGIGSSYTANTADWFPERNHRALRAIAHTAADYDPYADLYFPGGVPNAFMGRTWGLRVKDLDQNIRRELNGSLAPGVQPVDAPDGRKLLEQAIQAREAVPSVWLGLQEVTFRDDRPPTWNGASMNDWGIHSHADKVEKSNVPIQNFASWYDAGTANGAIRRFLKLSNPMRIFIGPWSHGGRAASNPFFPEQRSISPDLATQQLEHLCFIRRCLEEPLKRGDKLLSYYTVGEERWKTTRQWPLPSTWMQQWFFSAGGELKLDRPVAGGQDQYKVDFTVGTGRRNRWATNNDGGDVDYGNRAAIDSSLLTYTSEPLDKTIEITGHPVVDLYVTSTHNDGNFFVYLEMVAPDGTVRYLTEGQLRALHRKISSERPPYPVVGPYHSYKKKDAMPLLPGKPARLSFALHPMSARLPAGFRLRVAISGADADTFARIPAAGDPLITIHRTSVLASRITLPIVGL